MPPFDASAGARQRPPARRGQRVLVALIAGDGVDEIAAREGLTPKHVELQRRWVAPAEDYARMRIARLEAMAAKLAPKAAKDDLSAIDRMLKILDRLDRYHGFTRLTPAAAADDEEARERPLARLNAMAARVILPPKADA